MNNGHSIKRTWGRGFWALIALAILIPIAGVVVGIIGMVQDRESSGWLLVAGLVSGMFWVLLA